MTTTQEHIVESITVIRELLEILKKRIDLCDEKINRLSDVLETLINSEDGHDHQ